VGLGLTRYSACKEGHFEVVAALLEAEGILVDKATLRQGSTPLIAATHAGHVEIIQVRHPRSLSLPPFPPPVTVPPGARPTRWCPHQQRAPRQRLQRRAPCCVFVRWR